MTKAQGIRLIIFLIILALVFWAIFSLFEIQVGFFSQAYTTFKEMPDGSLDAVYIGASSVYRGWSSMYAYNDYGMTVYPLCSDGMFMGTVKYLIEEARKTQPDALYIIDYRRVRGDLIIDDSYIRKVTDVLPISQNRHEAINYLLDNTGIESEFDRWDYYFSFMLYHNRWIEGLRPSDFNPKYMRNAYCGSVITRGVSYLQTPVEPIDPPTDELAPLEEMQEKELRDLLAYLKENNINALFTVVPSVMSDKNRKELNTATKMIEDAGYTALNFVDEMDEMGIDLNTDFYNEGHLNMFGAKKYTDYFAKYLDENYDFEDHRGDSAYSMWDESFVEYERILSIIRKLSGV